MAKDVMAEYYRALEERKSIYIAGVQPKNIPAILIRLLDENPDVEDAIIEFAEELKQLQY